MRAPSTFDLLTRGEGLVPLIPAGPATKPLQAAAKLFRLGLLAAQATSELAPLLASLDACTRPAFAFEGAAVWLCRERREAVLVLLRERPQWTPLFLIGLGIADFASRRPIASFEHASTASLAGLSVEGHGFATGLLRFRYSFAGSSLQPPLSDYKRELFDIGRGRGLYFRSGGDFKGLEQVIVRQPKQHRFALWTGCSLAARHTGGAQKFLHRMQHAPDPLLAEAFARGHQRAELALNFPGAQP